MKRKRKIKDEEERLIKRKRKLELEHNEERKKERINDEERKVEIRIPRSKKDLAESGNFNFEDKFKNPDSNASEETKSLIDNVNIIFIN